MKKGYFIRWMVPLPFSWIVPLSWGGTLLSINMIINEKRVPILPFVALVAQGHRFGTLFALSVEYCIHYSCYWQHIFPWILYESPNIQTIIIFTLVFFFSLSLLFSFSFSFFMFFFLHFYIFCFYFSFFILRFCFCTLLFHFIYLFFFLKQFFGIFTFTRKGC